jgi:monomeric sarcosine oxidase
MNIAIVGLGGVGAMAAWRAAEAGHRVLAFEQFHIDHDRGSSYGDSRVVRRVYTDALYTALMAEAYPLWDDLQRRFPDRELFCRTGGIYCGTAGSAGVQAAHAALVQADVAHDLLDAQACRSRFPAFACHDDEVALYEPSMGYARPSRCVRAAIGLAMAAGAKLFEHTAIVDIEPIASGLRLRIADGETVEVERLLIAAGPWTGPRLQQLGIALPLVVTRQTYVYLQPLRHPEEFEAGRFPIWIDDATLAYGFPRLGDVPGVKLANHGVRQPTTAAAVDRVVHEADRQVLRDYAQQRLPWLGPQVLYEKVCLYTNTPDEDFIIDAVPGLPGAFVIGGLSGHGFKFTPLLAQIGLELLTATCRRDLSRFGIARFETS